jgi:hypothetical protein
MQKTPSDNILSQEPSGIHVLSDMVNNFISEVKTKYPDVRDKDMLRGADNVINQMIDSLGDRTYKQSDDPNINILDKFTTEELRKVIERRQNSSK